MRLRSLLILAVAGFGLAACAVAPLPPPQATLENIQAIRAANIAAVKVGEFVPGPGAPTQMDKKITIRAASQSAPSGSYAKLLGETLAAELKGAGKLDAGSGLVVSGVLTQTHVDGSMSHPTAKLEARFTVSKGAGVVFDKTLGVESAWEGAFMGAEAIPDAFNHYNALFPQLVTKLLSDPEFRAAARPGN